VDFIIANEGEPLVLIEAKLLDTKPSLALKKFQSVLKKPAVQLVEESVESEGSLCCEFSYVMSF